MRIIILFLTLISLSCYCADKNRYNLHEMAKNPTKADEFIEIVKSNDNLPVNENDIVKYWPPCFYAAKHSNSKIIYNAKKLGLNLNYQSPLSKKTTALLLAIPEPEENLSDDRKKNVLSIVEFLASYPRSDFGPFPNLLNATDESHLYPLFKAVCLYKKCCANKSFTNKAPLYMNIIKILKKNGADQNQKGPNDETCISLLSNPKNVDVSELREILNQKN